MPEREDVAGRLPPQDLDAEQSVLGAMLLAEAAVAEATELLKAEDFYRGGHGEIFAAMLDLYQGSEPVDQVTVCDRLEQRGSLEQVGGRPVVFALAEAVPVVTNARRYAEIVREMAMLRGLIRVGTEIAQLGYDRPGDTRELLDKAEQKVYEIAQNGHQRRTSRPSRSRSTRRSTGSRCCSRAATAAASPACRPDSASSTG